MDGWVKCSRATSSVEVGRIYVEYEMYHTKGHNNLTKLNEITSCICGRFSVLNNIWPWIGIS